MDTFELLPTLAAGELSETSAPELVAAVYRSRASGTLWIETPEAEIRTFYRTGYMCGAAPFTGFHTLAHVLLANDLAAAIDIDACREEAEAQKKRHGEVLVTNGVLTKEQLKAALQEQHRSNFGALLSIISGRYDWRGWEPPPAWAREVAIHPAMSLVDALALEQHAIRRRKILDWLGDSPARLSSDWPELHKRAGLQSAEQRAAVALQLPRSLDEFKQTSRLEEARAEALLVALLLLGGAEPQPKGSIGAAPGVEAAISAPPPAQRTSPPPQRTAPPPAQRTEPPPPAVPRTSPPAFAQRTAPPPSGQRTQPPPRAPIEEAPALELPELAPRPPSARISPRTQPPPARPPPPEPDLVLDFGQPRQRPEPASRSPSKRHGDPQPNEPDVFDLVLDALDPVPPPRPAPSRGKQRSGTSQRPAELDESAISAEVLPQEDFDVQLNRADAPMLEASVEDAPLELDERPRPGGFDTHGESDASRGLRKKLMAQGLRNLGASLAKGTPMEELASAPPVEGRKQMTEADRAFAAEVQDRLVKAPEQNAYDRLGVSPNASQETIKGAFLQLAKRFHPDRASGALATVLPELQALFNLLKEAHEAIGTKDARARYAETAREPRGDDPAVLVKMGEVLLKKRDFEGAIAKLRRAVEVDANADALAALAWGLMLDPKAGPPAREEAATLINKALRAPGLTARTYYVAGVLWRTKDPDSAVDAFRKAIELDATHSDAALELRLIEQRRGKQKTGGGVLSGLLFGKRK